MAQYGQIQPTSKKPGENQTINRKPFNEKISFFNQKQLPPRKLKIPQKDLLIFFRQLAVILKSGVPLAQGLELIAENMTNKKLASCVNQIATRLSGGEDLSSCLRQYPKVFKPITVGLIEAGETGGILDIVLDRVALLMEEQAKIRGQIIGALVYPILVLVLAISVSLGLLIFIVPKFKDMFDNMGAELPALTTFMLSLSKFVTSIYFAIGGPIIIILLIYLFKVSYGTKSGRLLIDKIILKVPLFGDLLRKSEMASMCDTLPTLVNSGIPIVEGLERCGSASSNQLIKNCIYYGINLVKQGQELNYALAQPKVLPNLAISMIKIGEETGQLSFMLDNLSMFYKRELDSTVSALTKAMEPAVIFVVAGIVGTIVISLYLPMFSLIENMGS